MTVANGEFANEDTFNDAFVSQEEDSVMAGMLTLFNMLRLYEYTDNAVTGATALIPNHDCSVIRLTSATLTGIAGLDLPTRGLLQFLINDTGADIPLLNNSTVTASKRLMLAGASDGLLQNGAMGLFYYDIVETRWRCLAGGGGGGGGPQVKNPLLNNQSSLANITSLLFDSSKETSAFFTVEIERIGSATFRQIVDIKAVYSGSAWSLGVGNFIGSDLIQDTITSGEQITLSITTGGQVQYTSGNQSGSSASNIKVIQNRMKV